jgi:hypothetical protein
LEERGLDLCFLLLVGEGVAGLAGVEAGESGVDGLLQMRVMDGVSLLGVGLPLAQRGVGVGSKRGKCKKGGGAREQRDPRLCTLHGETWPFSKTRLRGKVQRRDKSVRERWKSHSLMTQLTLIEPFDYDHYVGGSGAHKVTKVH